MHTGNSIQDCHGKRSIQKEEGPFTSKLDSNLRKNLVNGYICSIAGCGAGILKLGKLDQKYRGSSEFLHWRLMEKVSWTDHVRDGEVLHRVKEGRNIVHKIERRLIELATACVGTGF